MVAARPGPVPHKINLMEHAKSVDESIRFWPGLGLPSQRPMLSYQKINPCQNIYEKKRVKVRTMYLGLDIIIKLNFTTNFDRCSILNVLNCVD